MSRIERVGNAVLYLGDCRDILKELPSVDAIVTDPPYGISYASNPIVGKGKTASNHERTSWDDTIITAMDDIRNKGRHQIIWGGNYYALPPMRGWFVWYKPDGPPSLSDCELAWTNLDHVAECFVWSIGATNAERVGHPTQKPLALMEWCIIRLPPDVKTICDPFLGSGTTGVAAIKAGKSFIGIEQHEPYFDIAVRRIEEASKQDSLF